MVDYYSILDVSSNASEEEIRRAYRRKAKLHHPDVNAAPDAHHTFVQIQKAYQVLTNPYAKSRYDHQRYRQHDPLHSYQEWAARKQEKQERMAQRRREEFLKRQEAIRNSKLYYPYMVVVYFVTLSVLTLCLCILIGCAILVIKIHLLMFFFLLPFICIATYVLKYALDRYKEERALFRSVS